MHTCVCVCVLYRRVRRLKGGWGNSLVVQRLGPHASTVGVQVQSLIRELRSHKPAVWPKNEKKTKTKTKKEDHLGRAESGV